MTRTVKRIKHKCASLFFLLVPWSTCFLCFSYESTEVESCLTDSPKVTYLISNRIWVMLTLEDLGLFPLPYLLWALAKRDRSCLSWTRQLLTREEKTAIEGKNTQKVSITDFDWKLTHMDWFILNEKRDPDYPFHFLFDDGASGTICEQNLEVFEVSLLKNILTARTEILPSAMCSFVYKSHVNITPSTDLTHQYQCSSSIFFGDNRLVGNLSSYGTQVACSRMERSVGEESKAFFFFFFF